MNFDNYKFHCSSIGKLMTASRTKDPIGETTKKHLIECFVAEKYKRVKDVTNKYVQKGLQVEEDGVTLYSRVTKQIFKKNTQVFENEFFIGTPDIVSTPIVRDIKSSWDIWTFWMIIANAINPMYWWQLQGYMDVTGLDEARLAYVLINTPEALIQSEFRKLSYQFGIIDPTSQPLYLEACEKVRFEMTFNDIPLDERWIEFEVKRDDEKLNAAHEHVVRCRQFLNELSTKKSLK